jgi:hypothetical protein
MATMLAQGCAHHEQKDDVAALVLAQRVVARHAGIGACDGHHAKQR